MPVQYIASRAKLSYIQWHRRKKSGLFDVFSSPFHTQCIYIHSLGIIQNGSIYGEKSAIKQFMKITVREKCIYIYVSRRLFLLRCTVWYICVVCVLFVCVQTQSYIQIRASAILKFLVKKKSSTVCGLNEKIWAMKIEMGFVWFFFCRVPQMMQLWRMHKK